MKIKWYGHSAFKINTSKGTRIIIDPYESRSFGGALSYDKIEDEADIVMTSHDHADHNYIKSIKGKYKHISKAGDYEIQSVKIKAIPTFHDNSAGKERGHNLIVAIVADGLSLVHTGDIGHALDSDLLKKIGKVDILLLPVGGFFTIDAVQAAKLMNTLQPSITIPMHYKTDKTSYPIATEEDFLRGKKSVSRLNVSEVEFKRETLSASTQIMVLKSAL